MGAGARLQWPVIDSHICMPLPERMVGQWGSLATHPRIQNFVLSDEEVEVQVKAEIELLKRMKEEEEKKKPETKGWGEFTNNFRTATQRANEFKSKSLIEQIEEEYTKGAGESVNTKVSEQLHDYFKKLSSAANHLLLFRYFDFTVKPGKSYRYKVQCSH